MYYFDIQMFELEKYPEVSLIVQREILQVTCKCTA